MHRVGAAYGAPQTAARKVARLCHPPLVYYLVKAITPDQRKSDKCLVSCELRRERSDQG